MKSHRRFAFAPLAVLLLTATVVSGCVVSPSGIVYVGKAGEGEGPELEIIGVVNGLWEYDVEQNKERLRKHLPSATENQVVEWSTRYQVRVGVSRSFLGGKAAEVALLPVGWAHTSSNDATSASVIQPGDVVVLTARKGRRVDFVKAIHRRCDDLPTTSERPEHDIGCFDVEEFGRSGYGGKKFVIDAF